MDQHSDKSRPHHPAVPSETREGLSIPSSAAAYALMARNEIKFIRDLAADQGLGTSAHLGELAGQQVTCKILTSGGNEQMGGEVLSRERIALEAGLPALPQLIKVLQEPDGKLAGICRSFHPGSSVVEQVALGNLSAADFEKALRALLRSYEARGFMLQDTDAANFIIAAEFGIVNPAAVHRTLMLIDPEALVRIDQGIRFGEIEDTIKEVLQSLETQAARSKS